MAPKSSMAPMESGELRLYEGAGVGIFKGARILLAFSDPGRADSLAQELRALKAVVVVSGRNEQGLLRARDLDPEVVLVDKDSMVEGGVDLNELVRNDTRLRWAAIVVVRWEDIYPNEMGVAHMDRVASRVAPHRKFEELLSKTPSEKDQFEIPLERVGPARLLRALGNSQASLQVVAQTANRRFVIDLADGLVAGARLTRPGETEPISEGIPALAEFTELASGQARIEKKAAPASVNILLPFADALATAARESTVGRTSVAPPKITPPTPPLELPPLEELPDETTTRRDVGHLAHEFRFDDHTTKPGGGAEGKADPLDLHNASTEIKDLDDAPTRVSKAPTDAEPNAAPIPTFTPVDQPAQASTSNLTPTPVVPKEVLPILTANVTKEEPSSRLAWIAGGLVLGVLAAFGIAWWSRNQQPANDPYADSSVPTTPVSTPVVPAAELDAGLAVADEAAVDAGAPAAVVDAGAPAVEPEAAALAIAMPQPVVALELPTPAAPVAELTGEAALAESERLYELGRTAAEANNTSVAEQNFVRSSQVAVNNPHPMEGLARLYLSMQRGADARIWAEKLVALRRRRADFRVLLGEAAEMAGDSSAARSSYRSALEIDPTNASARRHLGVSGSATASHDDATPHTEPTPTGGGEATPAPTPAPEAPAPAPATPAPAAAAPAAAP